MSENNGVLEREIKSGSMKDYAMGRVIDLSVHYKDFVTHSSTEQKLESILRRGVYSSDFAEKIKDEDYESVYGAPHNKRGVSVKGGDWIPWGAVSVIISSRRVRTEVSLPGVSGEKLIPIRSAPRWFIGIGLYDPTPRTLKVVLETAQKVWDEKPENALPIYNVRDNSLIWPKRMTNKEIVDLIGDQDRRML